VSIVVEDRELKRNAFICQQRFDAKLIFDQVFFIEGSKVSIQRTVDVKPSRLVAP
jgi:hypothetical protein